jgi:hypothetical protein
MANINQSAFSSTSIYSTPIIQPNSTSGQMTWAWVQQFQQLALQLKTPVSTQVPASSSANGEAGQIATDSNYVYVAVGTNQWKRAALSSF